MPDRPMTLLLLLAVSLPVWAFAEGDKKPLTNADVVEMVRAGLAESTIILSIQNSVTSFDTSPQALIELKKNGVSQNVMEAMLSAGSKASASAPTAPAPVVSAASGPPDCKAVMAKVISALGGEKAVNAVKATKVTSIREVKIPAMNTTLEVAQTTVYPDRVHVTLKSPQFTSVTVYRPDGAFILFNGQLQNFPEPAQKETLKSIQLGIIYVAQHANDPKYTFSVNGSERIGETETAILEISTEGNQARWNVDPVSGRIISVTRMVTAVGGVPTLTRFEYVDWRTISGVTVPFKVLQNGVPAEEVKSYEINPAIPAGLFDKPSAAAAASTLSSPSGPASDGCPIEILEVNPHAFVTTDEDPWGWALKIKYRNVSGKEIVAEKFGANFFNALHDKKQSAWNYTSDQRIKPGETKSPNWGDGVYVNEMGMRIGVEVWPIKLMFADETFWEDDGSAKCKSAIWATRPK
jgi:hypothetical protein